MPRVRLLAPSGYPHDRAAVSRGLAKLHEAHCEIDGVEILHRIEQRFAGSDEQRAADINALAYVSQLPDIALSVRGGYGATRLLGHLHYAALRERLAESSLIFVGHSDFTALQMALYAQSGLISFSGPMLIPDFGIENESPLTLPYFWNTINAAQAQATWPCSNHELVVDVQGLLWGGNLAMLCSLLGTPYFPDIDDGILFIEDVSEPPYRIERLLYQLKLSGVLERQRALILGSFTQCHTALYDNGYDINSALLHICHTVDIPVVDGLPFGHIADKLTLPFGAPAHLRLAAGVAQLNFHGYPHLGHSR